MLHGCRGVELAVQQLLRASREQKFAVLSYCFMHAQKYRKTLWQRYGFEHVLRDDEATIEVAKYILANPVRAGLAATVEEYPHVGSFVYEVKNLISSTST